MTAGGEFAGRGDILPAYHAIDTNVPIGGLPFAAYSEMLEACGEITDLAPGAQHDAAWLRLEASIAMLRDKNPATGASFSTAEINAAQQQVRAEFRAIMADERTTPSVRAKAALALASVSVHYEMASKRTLTDKTRFAYLGGIQTAAKEFLPKRRGCDSEDFDILNTMLSLAVITEFTAKSVWPVPAPPRQPWHITVYNRKVVAGYTRILIGDEAAEGIVPIHLDALGDDYWEVPGWYASLMEYIKLKPGAISAKEEKLVFSLLAFREIWKRHRHYLDAYEAAHPGNTVVIGQVAVAAEVPSPEAPAPQTPTEVSWYLTQSAHDLRDINPMHHRVHLLNLKAVEAELAPAHRRALGWMQLDYGRMQSMESRRKLSEAAALRIQAERISRFNAPALLADATAREAEAQQLLEMAATSFDEAKATFEAAAKNMPPEKAGELFNVLLDAEAAPVYKALFTTADAEDIATATETYIRRLAALYLRLKQSEVKLKKDPDQLDALRAAALRTTFCLLVSDSSDEAARHFALPASMRAGGSRGEVDAFVIPVDYAEYTYDPEISVNVRITSGGELTVNPHHIVVGMDLLTTKGQILGLLSKLTAVVRSRKTGSGKKETRSADINALSLRVADAIADATE